MDDRQDEFRVEGATNLTGGQLSAVQAAAGDPARLETLYQSARASGAAQGFAAAIESARAEEPANLLYGAWHYRLLSAPVAETPAATSDGQVSERTVWQWRVAIPLSILLGFIFWILSAPGLTLSVEQTPAFVLIAPPLAAAFLIGFLAVGARAHYMRAALLIAALVALTVYVEVVGSLNIAGSADLAETYQYLAIIHLPVVAWGLVGLSLLGLSLSASSVFAFLTKSIEAIGTGGVFAIAGGIFVVLTVGLFQTLNINLDETVARLLLAGGVGLIPLIAVSAVYDTSAAPERQEFRRGFGKILAVLMQALLALSLVVMLIYILVIPFNFSEPFTDRETLIIYNIVLIGVMGVLLGATPYAASDLAPAMQRLVRAGIILLAVMVVGVSIYALAAVLYRTVGDALTMNRLTVIGWNIINIAILILLLARQALSGRANWIASLHDTFRWAAIAYLGWALFVLIASPLLF
ncbi:MAG TPA: hypothetical protein VH349_12355 [Ktedonobacterales bacterium]|jgi:hypothetical protein